MNQASELSNCETLLQLAESQSEGGRLLALVRSFLRFEYALKEAGFHRRAVAFINQDELTTKQVLAIAFDNGWFSGFAFSADREKVFSAIKFRNNVTHEHGHPDPQNTPIAVYTFCKVSAALRGEAILGTPPQVALKPDDAPQITAMSGEKNASTFPV